jgi:hypothetical protein
MKCKEFLHNMSDWVAERAGSDLASRMQAHSLDCPACAEALVEERELASLFQAVPEPSRTPDLWYKVSAKLEKPAAAPKLLWQRFYTMGGALAAAAVLCVIVLTNRPGSPTIDPVNIADAPRAGHAVSEIVYEVRHRPMQEAESAFFENSDYSKQKAVLLGYARSGE